MMNKIVTRKLVVGLEVKAKVETDSTVIRRFPGVAGQDDVSNRFGCLWLETRDQWVLGERFSLTTSPLWIFSALPGIWCHDRLLDRSNFIGRLAAWNPLHCDLRKRDLAMSGKTGQGS